MNLNAKHSVLLSRLVTLLIATSFAGQSAFSFIDKEPLDYWRDTKLTYDLVAKKIENHCYESSVKLVACIQALNAAAGNMEPATVLVTEESLKFSPALYKAFIRKIGPFSLYQAETDKQKMKAFLPKGKLANFELWKKSKDAQITGIKRIFDDKSAARVSFSDVLKQFAPKHLPGSEKNDEAYLASLVFTTYYNSAVDAHGHLDVTQELIDQSNNPNVSYAGVGMTISPSEDSENGAVIVDFNESGPAMKSGLRIGDLILSVDKNDATHIKNNAVKDLLIGTAGTQITVTVSRKGKTLSFPITRAVIQSNMVTSKTIKDAGSEIGYIRYRGFQGLKTCNEIYETAKNFESQGAKALILDLRKNGGGDIRLATCLGAIFVGMDQNIVTAKYLDPQTGELLAGQEQYYAGVLGNLRQPPARVIAPMPTGAAILANNFIPIHLPLGVLVDAGSASASEIVSGALQDYKRGWILGETTYGKATVQSGDVFDMSDSDNALLSFSTAQENKLDQSISFYHTVARFYQPLNRTNQSVGIKPDFEIDPVPNATADQKFSMHESDYFANALPALGAPWVNTRLDEVKPIAECARADKMPETMYKVHKDDVLGPDYRLYMAESFMNCAVK